VGGGGGGGGGGDNTDSGKPLTEYYTFNKFRMAALLDSDLAYAKEGPKAKVAKMYGSFRCDIKFDHFSRISQALSHCSTNAVVVCCAWGPRLSDVDRC